MKKMRFQFDDCESSVQKFWKSSTKFNAAGIRMVPHRPTNRITGTAVEDQGLYGGTRPLRPSFLLSTSVLTYSEHNSWQPRTLTVHCKLYSVQSTLGCCHLLAIVRASGYYPKRGRVPTAGSELF